MRATTSTYKVKSNNTLIYKSTSTKASVVARLSKGTKIEVISIANSWAYFIYNGNNAYIKVSNITLVPVIKGSVTIKYLDVDSNISILDSISYENLELKSYTYSSQNITGYKLSNNSSQMVTLTQANPNQIITFLYKKILGSIIVKYIDSDTNLEVSSQDVFSNLALGSYSYTAKEFDNYNLSNSSTQSITLTQDNTNQVITFSYKKILGSVTINYINTETKENIISSETYFNLELGNYTYDTKSITNYTLISDLSKSITLTKTTPNITINFEYKLDEVIEIIKPLEPLDPSKQNEVPYISTYYIKPIVKPDEEVIIDYYITDYYHKEYVNEDFSETFKVTVRIEGKEDIIINNLQAGDHSVSLGTFPNLDGQEQKFSILCTDKYGRNSHELFNFFLVRNEVTIKEYIMTEQDLKTYGIKNNDDYETIKLVNVDTSSSTISDALQSAYNTTSVESNKYLILIADTNNDGKRDSNWNQSLVKYGSNYDSDFVMNESTNTREGLQKLLNDKKAAGYNRLRLLKGVYRINHLGTIYIPTNFTLDMNGSTFKLNGFSGNSSVMLDLNNTFDSHVINGIIEGDYYSHDYTNSPNNSEWVNGINLSSGSKYSSFENLTIKDITGYGACNGASKPINTDLLVTYLYPIWLTNSFQFILGDIDRNTGLDIESNNRTTCPYVNISGYRSIGYLMIGKYLGYQGIRGDTWNLICHFYDDNKSFIKSIDAYQYRKVGIPSNATYVRITILNEAYPTDLSIQLFRVPTHCSFKNIKFYNCRCVGLAQSAMNDMFVENCEFSNCGQSAAKCAYDAEDGWDMMQDVTFRNLNFHDNPQNDFLTCGGHNFVIEDMINGKIYLWPRTNSYVVRNNNNLKSTTLGRGTRIYNGYVRVYNNIANGNVIIDGYEPQWPLIVKDCTINGKTQNNLESGLWIRCDIGGHATSSYKYDTALGKGNYIDCYIHDKWGENQGGIYKNCRFYNIYGNLHSTFEINSCDINKFHGFAGDPNTIFTLKDSTLNNFKIEYGYWTSGSSILIENCNINNNDFLLKLPHYAMKQPISIIKNTILSTSSVGLVYFYDDRGETSPQNILNLESNNISLSNSKYIINGLSNTTVNNINIVALNNTYNPTSLLLSNPLALQSHNISIKQ